MPFYYIPNSPIKPSFVNSGKWVKIKDFQSDCNVYQLYILSNVTLYYGLVMVYYSCVNDIK